VDGQPEAVHIEALDVPLREVFDALLQAKFNLRYRTGDGLDTRMTGTFNGPLRRVAARMLDGYDFAMKITPQGIDVLVLGQNKPDDKPGAAAAPARTMPEGSPAPVMTAAEANRCERRLSPLERFAPVPRVVAPANPLCSATPERFEEPI
jgi:hypothetical protein